MDIRKDLECSSRIKINLCAFSQTMSMCLLLTHAHDRITLVIVYVMLPLIFSVRSQHILDEGVCIGLMCY